MSVFDDFVRLRKETKLQIPPDPSADDRDGNEKTGLDATITEEGYLWIKAYHGVKLDRGKVEQFVRWLIDVYGTDGVIK